MSLGIDLGTSALKALLIDEGQRVVATRSEPLRLAHPSVGWSEQDPASWVTAAEGALDSLKLAEPTAFAAVRGIGLSGQMHGAVFIDAANRPLRPAILWNDTRAHAEAAKLDGLLEFRALTGNIVFPGFTAPKVVWTHRNEPELFSRVAKVLLPKDFLRLWLTGEHVTDMSDASGTSWLHTEERCWSKRLLDYCQLDESQVPRLVEGTEVSGTLRPALAERWGMSSTTVVAGGGGDNAASGCGVGALAPGTGFISIGTSGVIFVSADRYRANPESAVHAFCHAVPNTWHQMGVALSAAGSLDWIAGILDAQADKLVRGLGPSPVGPGAIQFLPYLSGERTPHNDAKVRGAFVGLDRVHGRSDLVQAVLEGVAFSFRDCLDAVTIPLGEPAQLLAVGGGARSRYWLSIIATVLDLRIGVPAGGEVGAALGAARFGLIAAENANPFDVCLQPPLDDIVEPIAALVDDYADAYRQYCRLYSAIKGL
jgi:xylulokinase